MIRELIAVKLGSVFNPVYLDIINESYRHNVPIGSKSHFKVIIVSNNFISKCRLIRHRSIYSVLSVELASSVYSLTLYAYTLQEWQQKYNQVPDSPCCSRIRSAV